jgi:hypothetical protein
MPRFERSAVNGASPKSSWMIPARRGGVTASASGSLCQGRLVSAMVWLRISNRRREFEHD